MTDLDVSLEEAVHLVRAERYREAADTLERVLAEDPGRYSAALMLGAIYTDYLPDLVRSRDLLTRLIELYPEDGRAYYVLGYCEANDGHHERAAELLQQAIRHKIRALDQRCNPGKLYFSLAAKAYAEGRTSDYDELIWKATEYNTKAVRQSPKALAGLVNLGACYLSLGQYNDALKHYKKAVRIWPESVEALGGKLLACVRLYDFRQARSTVAAIRKLGAVPSAIKHLVRQVDEHTEPERKDDGQGSMLSQPTVEYRSVEADLNVLLRSGTELRVELPDFCVISLVDGQLRLRFEEKRPVSAPLVRFPTPKGTEWQDVTIQIMSNDSARVMARGVKEVLTFAEMGFKDRRKGDLPDTQWETLKVFAENSGQISWDSSDAQPKIQKRIQALRAKLKALLGIDDDPFYPYRKTGAYKTKFTIEDVSRGR